MQYTYDSSCYCQLEMEGLGVFLKTLYLRKSNTDNVTTTLPQLMEHLGGAHGKVFYDLGSGLGKMCMQVAVDWGALRAVGVELAATRHSAAEAVRGQLGSRPELPSRLKVWDDSVRGPYSAYRSRGASLAFVGWRMHIHKGILIMLEADNNQLYTLQPHRILSSLCVVTS